MVTFFLQVIFGDYLSYISGPFCISYISTLEFETVYHWKGKNLNKRSLSAIQLQNNHKEEELEKFGWLRCEVFMQIILCVVQSWKKNISFNQKICKQWRLAQQKFECGRPQGEQIPLKCLDCRAKFKRLKIHWNRVRPVQYHAAQSGKVYSNDGMKKRITWW